MIHATTQFWVVDASVIGAAFFHEELEDRAWSLFASPDVLLAPGMIVEEVGNIIWKRFRRGEIVESKAEVMLADCLRLELRITPSVNLIHSALSIAMDHDRSVYDSLYVALAMRNSTTMLTTDKRLVNALAGGPLEKYVKWLGDVE